MTYRRDVPRDDRAAIDVELAHVRDHLAAIADANDDPNNHREWVRTRIVGHVDGDANLVTIIGELNARPVAPYLRDDYDPAADHPDIAFRPFGEHDADAFAAWQAGS
jgi:hypothetical protein